MEQWQSSKSQLRLSHFWCCSTHPFWVPFKGEPTDPQTADRSGSSVLPSSLFNSEALREGRRSTLIQPSRAYIKLNVTATCSFLALLSQLVLNLHNFEPGGTVYFVFWFSAGLSRPSTPFLENCFLFVSSAPEAEVCHQVIKPLHLLLLLMRWSVQNFKRFLTPTNVLKHCIEACLTLHSRVRFSFNCKFFRLTVCHRDCIFAPKDQWSFSYLRKYGGMRIKVDQAALPAEAIIPPRF